MNYRTYLDGLKGYETLGTYNEEETVFILDHLILEKEINRKVLVIEENTKENWDNPVFLYLGNKQEYLEFRESLHSRIEKSGNSLAPLAKDRGFKSHSCNQKEVK